MKAFSSKIEMATEYMNCLNDGISADCNKWEDVNEVIAVCVYEGLRIFLKPKYGIEIQAKSTPVIDNFGYVIA